MQILFFPGLARLLGLKEYKFNVYVQDRIRSIFFLKRVLFETLSKTEVCKIVAGKGKKGGFQKRWYPKQNFEGISDEDNDKFQANSYFVAQSLLKDSANRHDTYCWRIWACVLNYQTS